MGCPLRSTAAVVTPQVELHGPVTQRAVLEIREIEPIRALIENAGLSSVEVDVVSETIERPGDIEELFDQPGA